MNSVDYETASNITASPPGTTGSRANDLGFIKLASIQIWLRPHPVGE
jgi:hypothetical protein